MSIDMSGTCYDRLIFRVQRHAWTDGVQLQIAMKGPSAPGTPTYFQVMNPPTFMSIPPGGAVPTNAGMNITMVDAQVLMDELYAAGVRPTEGAGSPGQIAAMKEHLSDLRRLVFKGDETATKGTW